MSGVEVLGQNDRRSFKAGWGGVGAGQSPGHSKGSCSSVLPWQDSQASRYSTASADLSHPKWWVEKVSDPD